MARAQEDGPVITKEHYGQELESKLKDLHERLRTKRYRYQPIQRVHIPKEKGRARPIGISTIEDKVVQNALRTVLETVYEQDFLDCSYGFRPGRSAHDAVRALTRAVDVGEANWILEFDIASFFDSVSRLSICGRQPLGDRWTLLVLRLLAEAPNRRFRFRSYRSAPRGFHSARSPWSCVQWNEMASSRGACMRKCRRASNTS